MQIKIIHKKKSEDCFADTEVYDYEISVPFTLEHISLFKKEKEFMYYDHFPTPMFKVITSSNIQIKGLLNETQCRVIYPKETEAREIERIENLICYKTT